MTPFLQEGDHNLIMPCLNSSSEHTFIYRSKVMDKVVKLLSKVAPSKSSILIIGQPGVGKTHLARAIHEKSSVAMGPFVTLHCGSLTSQIFENELFGFKGENHHTSIEGAIRKADGGTLVLDEITKMPINIRKKFSKFLKNKVVEPVNSARGFYSNVRIIYSTSDETAIMNGTFDKHLYDEMNSIKIEIPNISERREDVADLVQYFLSQNLVNRTDTVVKKISVNEKAMNTLKCYRWPRNVREIRDVCEHLQLFNHDSEVCVKDLPKHILDTKDSAVNLDYDPTLTLSDLNRIYILGALKHFPSKKRAAVALGITVKTLYNRLHEYGVFDRYSIHG